MAAAAFANDDDEDLVEQGDDDLDDPFLADDPDFGDDDGDEDLDEDDVEEECRAFYEEHAR